jgi:glutathione S-transferase
MTTPHRLAVCGLPATWGAPSPSPFVIKLLTWLRMAEIEHEMVRLRSPPRSTTGKIPYVELPDGRRLADSGLIIEALSKERGIDLDAHLDPLARSRGHLVRRTLEESLYFSALYERFMTPEGFAYVRRDYFRAAPWIVRKLAPVVVRRNVRRILHWQGDEPASARRDRSARSQRR